MECYQQIIYSPCMRKTSFYNFTLMNNQNNYFISLWYLLASQLLSFTQKNVKMAPFWGDFYDTKCLWAAILSFLQRNWLKLCWRRRKRSRQWCFLKGLGVKQSGPEAQMRWGGNSSQAVKKSWVFSVRVTFLPFLVTSKHSFKVIDVFARLLRANPQFSRSRVQFLEFCTDKKEQVLNWATQTSRTFSAFVP